MRYVFPGGGKVIDKIGAVNIELGKYMAKLESDLKRKSPVKTDLKRRLKYALSAQEHLKKAGKSVFLSFSPEDYHLRRRRPR